MIACRSDGSSGVPGLAVAAAGGEQRRRLVERAQTGPQGTSPGRAPITTTPASARLTMFQPP